MEINKNGVKRLEEDAMHYVIKLAEKVKNDAKDNCPVKSGKLKDSIDILSVIDKTVEIGTQDTGYGLYVEMGSSRQAAQPFLRPSLDSLAG